MKPRNYLQAWLYHPAHLALVSAGLSVAGLAGVFGGLPEMALSAVGLLAVEGVALLNVPGSTTFQRNADRRFEDEEFAEKLTRLSAEVPQSRKASVERMLERLEGLQSLERDSSSAVSREDVLAVRQAIVVYLSLINELAPLNRRDSYVSADAVRSKIGKLEKQRQKADGVQAKHLEKAIHDYKRIYDRQINLGPKRQRIEAALELVPDQVEEIHQVIISASAGGVSRSQLDLVVDRLQFIEQLEADDDFSIDPLMDLDAARADTVEPIRARRTQPLSH
jgi:hypothetical protein